MCGIIGYIGYECCYCNILNGLKQLQNRGYDSAGISTIADNKFITTKYASTQDETAITKLTKYENLHQESHIGIGHTRWATHGEKSDINSHPHIDFHGNFSLVHNGIIENYQDIKVFLEKNEFKLVSQTDTEVIVNLISYYYNLCKNVTESINKTIEKIEGSYALCIICRHEPDMLYCIRRGSPLLVGICEKYAIVASENSGFCNMIKNCICLDDNDLCIIKKKNKGIKITTNNMYKERTVAIDTSNKLGEYKHWMLKEIMEQPEAINRAINMGGRLASDETVKLGGLDGMKKELLELNNLILLGCGTSYNACLIGCDYFKDMCNFNTVQVFDGAEFSEKDIPKKYGKTGLLLLSQSGETKDLFRCIDIGKKNDMCLIGCVNVNDSLIAREVNCGVYINAGREVAVASTKSFTSQVIVLSLISIWFAQNNNLNIHKRREMIASLRRLSLDVRTLVESSGKYVTEIAKYLLDHNTTFILGKGQYEFYAKEASLKLKEIGYIHAEAYSSSALKHGPYSLIVPKLPIILFVYNDTYVAKNMSIIEEIKSRDGYVICISDMIPSKCDKVIPIPHNKVFRGILSVVVTQLISYEIALLKGHDPDMPRNLAKVVTVD